MEEIRVNTKLGASIAIVVTLIGLCLPYVNRAVDQYYEKQLILNVIDIEVQATNFKDLRLLESIYSSNPVIIDQNGSPENLNDDIVFDGWDRIKERYISVFNDFGINTYKLADISIIINGDKAMVFHDGIYVNDVYYKDRGKYYLEKINNAWMIKKLEYHLY